MKVLIVHNDYNVRGGETVVVENEVELLKSKGLDISTYFVSNSAFGFLGKLSVSFSSIFSIKHYLNIVRKIKSENIDIVHVHNFFPLISPSVVYACKKTKVPVVFTLHNFRLICPSATFLVDGKVEERSLFQGPWWTIRKKTYRGSYLGTFVLAFMIWLHKKIGTWGKVDKFIVLNEFSKQKFVEFGFLEDQIEVKPNFSPDLDQYLGEMPLVDKDYYVYVGRLSKEKGISELISCWKKQSENLLVIGGGALENTLRQACSGVENIKFLGALPHDRVLNYVSGAKALILPSICYEQFPVVIAEAFGLGVPVVANRTGSMESLIEEGRTGYFFDVRKEDSILRAIRALAENRDSISSNCLQISGEILGKDSNFYQLIAIYKKVVRKAS